jgi:hypothetical protein
VTGRAALLVLAACGNDVGVPLGPGPGSGPGSGSGSAIEVALDLAHPGRTLPVDFLGASYETSTLLPGSNGDHYFDPANLALLATFDTLGLTSLRLGGNESESGPLPSNLDISLALQFVARAHVDLLYTLRMATYDPTGAAAVARFILDNATAGLRCFSLGNEGIDIPDYATYQADAAAYMAAIGDPRARYCAPDMFGAAWPAQFAIDFVTTGQVSAADMHAYFGGDGQGTPAAAARDLMLSDGFVSDYAASHDAIASALADTGVPFRLSETNSFYNGGCPGASDTFASALWGLDYLSWWAAHDADGINFHTGDHVSGATTTYSLFKTSPTGYHVHPLGYAVKAFALASSPLGSARVIPVSTEPVAGLTAYAVVAASGDVYVTVIDKTHDGSAREMPLAIATPFAHAEQWTLDAGGDVTATDGVTLGGATIGDDASWSGSAVPVAVDGGIASVVLAPASAAVVRMWN